MVATGFTHSAASFRGPLTCCFCCPVRYTTRMEVKAKKTVRFDALIKEAGQPVQVPLWTNPEDEPLLKRPFWE